ncbi:MAG: helix-turn-helix transcriptional regulator [Lachnospiraceae bacterium]|nr:helix-turn-helix transcriptional regulator [Lachnospiraceae bacterium]
MEAEKTRNCTESQAELAKQASSYVLERMDKRITIKEIADQMHVSQTQLKNSFRNYYGNSVYKYIRSKKMEQAAALLAEGQLSVMEIAGRFGYENCSKFAAAFRGEYGMSPSDYRRQHRQEIDF